MIQKKNSESQVCPRPRLCKVNVVNEQRDLKVSVLSLRRAARTALTYNKVTCDEVCIHLVSEKIICDLHDRYFQDPSPTDCITFPLAPTQGYHLLGECFLCPKTALLYASSHKSCPYRELTLYLVHSLLHLLGYDDMTRRDQKKMFAQQTLTLDHIEQLGHLLHA